MTSKKPKTIEQSVDNLAKMVKIGFDEVKIGFDEIGEEMHGLEVRLTKKLDIIDFNTNSQERRITILEDKVRLISTKIGLTR